MHADAYINLRCKVPKLGAQNGFICAAIGYIRIATDSCCYWISSHDAALRTIIVSCCMHYEQESK